MGTRGPLSLHCCVSCLCTVQGPQTSLQLGTQLLQLMVPPAFRPLSSLRHTLSHSCPMPGPWKLDLINVRCSKLLHLGAICHAAVLPYPEADRVRRQNASSTGLVLLAWYFHLFSPLGAPHLDLQPSVHTPSRVLTPSVQVHLQVGGFLLPTAPLLSQSAWGGEVFVLHEAREEC